MRSSKGLVMFAVTFLWAALNSGCSVDLPRQDLPSSDLLGSPRGNKISRVISHLHSVYSYDACDKVGIAEDGTINQICHQNLLNALCVNHVDFAFLTDHPSNMVDYSFTDLLLSSSGDELFLNSSGDPYAKKMSSCTDGHQPVVSLGFEATSFMAIGMKKHLEPTADARRDAYQSDTRVIRDRLQTETEALVTIPHTESKDVAWMKTIQPDAIEVYNFHANTDPKIRKRDLGVRPFENIAAFLTFLFDPFHQLVPDFGFIQFLETFDVYFTKWHELILSGNSTTGLMGADSHENVFPQKVSDNERLDSHRRVTRVATNMVLSADRTLDSIKSSIRQGRVWMVFEGFGSPEGFDFYAETSSTQVGVGETITASGATVLFQGLLPKIQEKFPQGSQAPEICIFLKKIESDYSSSVVAQVCDQSLSYETQASGYYRLDVQIKPRHLLDYLGDFSSYGTRWYPWIITNYIQVN